MMRLSHSLPGCQSGPEGPTTPHMQRLTALTHARFGLIRFRSPLLTEYLFLSVLRCFTSRRSLHAPYIFRCGSPHMTVAGFPHSDILGSRFVCQLPEAYRRLQRPSSAPSAKASTLCPYKLHTQNCRYQRHTSLMRCSRPLCSSQATDDPTLTDQASARPARGDPYQSSPSTDHPPPTGRHRPTSPRHAPAPPTLG